MIRILMQIINLTCIHVYLKEHHNQILGETFLIHAHTHIFLISVSLYVIPIFI